MSNNNNKYRVVMKNQFGKYCTEPFDESEKRTYYNLLDEIGTLEQISLTLEDGSDIFLNKEMIGRSMFLIEKVQEKPLTEREAPASVAADETKNLDEFSDSNLYRNGWDECPSSNQNH